MEVPLVVDLSRAAWEHSRTAGCTPLRSGLTLALTFLLGFIYPLVKELKISNHEFAMRSKCSDRHDVPYVLGRLELWGRKCGNSGQ